MSEALYGLLGALGGALITGAAAYWGPLQLQRRERQQHEGERLQNESAAQRTAQVSRIINIRTTARVWSDVLNQHLTLLLMNQKVDIEQFDAHVMSARSDAASALDQALHDGVWFQQTNYPHYGREPASALEALSRLTDLLRAAVIEGGPLDEARSSELKRASDDAQTARGRLSTALLNRLETSMGVTIHSSEDTRYEQ